MYLDSLINDHFLAYVSGPRFVNPISIPLLTLFYQFAWARQVCRGRHLQALPFRRTDLALCISFHISITAGREQEI